MGERAEISIRNPLLFLLAKREADCYFLSVMTEMSDKRKERI
jgi:hypothetical protein